MKKQTLVITATLFVLVTCQWGTATEKLCGQWHNSLKPMGQAGSVLTLAENGKSDYVIVLSADAAEPEIKAAEQLQYWLEQITTARLPIATEQSLTPEKNRIISVGRTQLLEKTFSKMAAKELTNGGWGVAADESNLFLWGDKNRGCVNAVFAFLEEDLGCRWYTKEHSRIPKSDTLKIAPVLRTYSPPLKLRDPFSPGSFNWKWSLHNRTNAPDARVPEEYGGRIDYGDMFVHTFDRLVPPDKYFDEHPEYFMLDEDGNRSKQQLCMTNPDVIRLIIQRVHESLAKHPHTEIISVSKNDLVKICLCEGCKAMDEAEGGTNMGSMLHLVNRVAQSIEDEYPDVDISTLAYMETIELPKTVRPADNVIIRLCNDSVGSWNQPFTPAEECKFAKLVKTWSSVHDKIYIWDYIVNFSHYMAPMPNIDIIAENIRFYVDHNAKGIMTQGSYQGPGAEREWMRSWVVAKLMLYPSLDVNELINDFIYGHFGNAAEPVAAYNRLLKKQREKYKKELKWPEGGIRYNMDSPFLSKEFLDQATRLFDEAEKMAENEAVLHRVERERLPVMYVKLVRGPEFTGDEYGALVKRFEEITMRLGVTHLSEGPSDIEAKIQDWKKQWEAYNNGSKKSS